LQREQRLNDVRTAFTGKEHDLWCLHVARRPDHYGKNNSHLRPEKPVILVANLKGGVGKSTLVANLAAFFKESGKRVLLIDGDYQGSLSNMLLSADGISNVSPEVNKLLQPGSNVASFNSAIRPFSKRLRGSTIVASNYELAPMENRVMIEYLLKEDKEKDDGRYRLANLLLNQEVAKTFDIALIDAPPRLTAATINGFCASTHLLVPTVYDTMSSEAIGTFLSGVQRLRGWLNQEIELLGIVGMLTSQQDTLKDREKDARNAAMRQVSQVWDADVRFFDRHIPRKEAIAKAAGEDIAYYCDPIVKGWFDELGRAISHELWPRSDATTRQAMTPRRASRVLETALPPAE
jgi:cellulose biosynthesis protein BcsQ